MKIIYNKIDKKSIADMPRVVFPGRIFVVLTEQEAERAVAYLQTFSVLGIDSETRPSFKKGRTNKVALLQVATEDTCFLFRLNRIGLPDSLVGLLENSQICKVGLSLKDDLTMLQKRKKFVPGGFVELQQCVHDLGIMDQSLQKIYANLFGQKISKGQQLTNWEADVLTENQKLYAATDAWVCLHILQELKNLQQTGGYQLVVLPETPKEKVAVK